MDELPLSALIGALVILLILSAFFSGTETAMMTLNRYRLRHLVRAGNRAAQLTESLLKRPDRLLGVILLCNNAVNLSASAISTLIAYKVGGEVAVILFTAGLTVTIIIFAEVTPKTLAALHPQQIALPAAYIYRLLLWVTYPLVWLINLIANSLLRIFGVSPTKGDESALSREELRTVVIESGIMMPKSHRAMLLGIFDLEEATVEDIMVPRAEIVGIDLEDEWHEIEEQLRNSQYTRLLVYRDTVDNIVGLLHLRHLFNRVAKGTLTLEALHETIQEPYYIPEGTPLHTQLINFQKARKRIGLVVDEYGDLQGLATIEDILEEIVGEFTTDPAARHSEITAEADGSYIVNGNINVRALNRNLNWNLPTDGPKTLNGLILEYLENIPQPGTSMQLGAYQLEIVQTTDSAVKTVRIQPGQPDRQAVQHDPS
ncbi:MAG: HlyC/CorC family transporter [Gammaproteobacteria bacterium]